ncbi:bifunctional 4-hydroxy-2-oxoglutarate aldolase/2-dehydro-3-deoxy-phosphogluconate aldolase [Shumkonia mesophila]|uniref:bifunctional 4-hydroxy-2-oxoglutarate aldolase/2-dehydro-3-deoxy-phosphogluconate aldolase n=1 Tax=Shumkonia mesophila TaxID=2838854 RepID=UPI0029349E48|nr:bifunctional 4-hydroxy-2-oxoglutarate aldolase/2-dehydro-3-deoxy-phosphogluconate aldolase [Shumkonia mesophila]
MSKAKLRMIDLLSRVRVIPIVTIRDASVAVNLAEALMDGGLHVFEVLLRTPAALAAVEQIRKAVPEAFVGAGTLLDRKDVERAIAAGARFGVSPGLTRELGEAVNEHGLPFLPGVSSASEIMQAMALGFTELKFFPAFGAAGTAWLKIMAPVFSAVTFCPTGGIKKEDIAEYMKLPNCRTVGCSWVASASLIEAHDWPSITALARQVSKIGLDSDA